MASNNSTTKNEWLVIVHDKPGMLSKRMDIRPQHISNLSPNVNQGKILMGGAIFDPQPSSSSSDSSRGDITGSAMLFAFDTREEVVELLKSDIYAKNGVWDVENATIIPFRSAVRSAM